MTAHGSLTLRIKEKTIEISKDSLNAELYFERGILYQQHFEFNKAISDFNKSENLGYSNILLHFRKAEALLANNEPQMALESTNRIFIEKSFDAKIYKLRAQIFNALNVYDKAIENYKYVMQHMIDIKPSDIIKYSEIILAQNKNNYDEALNVIEKGLKKIGEQTLTLNLKKLEYLKKLGNNEEVVSQYNYFLLNNKRKEFWYYKKAKFLFEIEDYSASRIALQQAKVAIQILKPRIKQTPAILNLQKLILELEKTLTYD